MNSIFRRIIAVVAFTVLLPLNVNAQVPTLNVDGKSACIMEKSTGKFLFIQNEDERLPLASVTKIMTLILIYDSVAQGKITWDSPVTVSEHAASMGGSQIFLEPNEVQSVETLTKSIAIASANDAAVAMAEFIGGSEDEFVKMMNEKAKELCMENTNFQNACGLDTDNHYSSAEDIALMSRYLLNNYPDVEKYTTTWQDTITHSTRKGNTEFTLTNTNRLIKWYNGATGLKTGSTNKAKYCLAGSAKRDNMELIAVVMGAPDPKVRFREVMKMLDYGFANYQVSDGEDAGKSVGEVKVSKGMKDSVQLCVKDKISVVTEKGNNAELKSEIIPESVIAAPFEKGTKAGEIIYYCNDKEVGRSDLVTAEGVEKADFFRNVTKLIPIWF
jgi:D-alanyl-D-alanine carboxypeptidase (penicillin-binding protein 5/6)